MVCADLRLHAGSHARRVGMGHRAFRFGRHLNQPFADIGALFNTSALHIALDQGFIDFRAHPYNLGDGLNRHIVGRRPKSSSGNHHPSSALAGVFEHPRQLVHIVVENRDPPHIATERGDLLRHPEGIGVLDLPV